MATKKKKSQEQISKEPKAPKVPSKWGTTVRVGWDLYDHIKKHGQFQESFDVVLRRMLGI